MLCQATLEKRTRAFQNLAKMMESFVQNRGFPCGILSFNLHILVCRLFDQEAARGCIGLENEMWVERLIHVLKEVTRYRCSSEPERVAVNTMLIDSALLNEHLRHPDLKTIQELRDNLWTGLRGTPDKLAPDTDGSIFLGSSVIRNQANKVRLASCVAISALSYIPYMPHHRT